MSSSVRHKNITFDDRDDKLKYAGSWFHEGTWNASSVHQTGTLSTSNDPQANVTFTFPQPAVAFYYYGIRRSRGARYAICIDCDPNAPRFESIDGLNTTDDGTNPPIVLYSKVFDTPGQHIVILTNQNDTRGTPSGNSQITVDRFDLEIIDDSPAITATQNPGSPAITVTQNPGSPAITVTQNQGSPAITVTQNSGSPAITVTQNPGSPAITVTQNQGSPTNTSLASTSSTSAPIGAIVGGAVGGFLAAVILITIGFLCWRRRRRRKIDEPFPPPPQPVEPYPIQLYPQKDFPITTTSLTNTYPSSGSPPSTVTGSFSVPSSSTSSANTISSNLSPTRRSRRERRRERRREVDAGPVSVEEGGDEENEDSLPPLYEQVFRVGRRGTVNRSSSARHRSDYNDHTTSIPLEPLSPLRHEKS